MSSAPQNLQLLGSIILALAAVHTTGCMPVGEDLAEQAEGDDETTDPSTALETPKRQITYIVIPHPDDEYEAWSLVENSSGNYPVFILLTQGEQSGYCNPDGVAAFEPEYGEVVEGHPWSGRWTPGCSGERLAAFHRFMDGMAVRDRHLPHSPPFVGTFFPGGTTIDGSEPSRHDWDGQNGNPSPYSSRAVKVWRDAKGARVVFDLGDGDLTTAEVVWALETVKANKAAWDLPALPEYAHIGASFYNASYPDCTVYTHRDHRAIHDALWAYKFGASHQWARTCASDPDVAATGGRVKEITRGTHEHAFAGSATSRVGQHAIHYGWLANPYFSSCEDGCLFARVQAFWRQSGR